jgi:cytochrome P450
VSITKADVGVPCVSSSAFWSQPASQRAFAFEQLRRTAPVSFQRPPDFGRVGASLGFWAITRHEDVVSVSRNPDLFCSSQGVELGDTPADLLELNSSFVVMDPPRHTAVRRVVNGAFTPKRVAQLKQRIEAEAERIVDEFVETGDGDVVEDFSRKLPVWTICEILGVPESLRPRLASAAEVLLTQGSKFESSAEINDSAALRAGLVIHRIAAALLADRRLRPRDDILSGLVHSELDGEPLSEQILRNIFVLFITAGNDTTRNTTSHALKLFADNPEQWSLLVNDRTLVASAVEEMVRCASPVILFRRTARADTVLGGVDIAEGDPVVMFYESANHDESVFCDPERFDITRDPNPHVGFGGGGAHFCLGANLARVELRALFARLAERVTSIEVGEPSYLASSFFNGITRMPVRVMTQ